MLIALNVMNPSTSSRETLRFSGNKIHCSAVVKCLLLNEQFFFLRKREKVVKTTSHNIYSDVASAGKKEGFLS